MNNEQLRDERLSEIVYETETIGAAALSHGELVAIAHELKIARVEIARLEAMVTAQDTVIGDERRAHEVEIVRLQTQLGNSEMMSAELIFPKRGK